MNPLAPRIQKALADGIPAEAIRARLDSKGIKYTDADFGVSTTPSPTAAATPVQQPTRVAQATPSPTPNASPASSIPPQQEEKGTMEKIMSLGKVNPFNPATYVGNDDVADLMGLSKVNNTIKGGLGALAGTAANYLGDKLDSNMIRGVGNSLMKGAADRQQKADLLNPTGKFDPAVEAVKNNAIGQVGELGQQAINDLTGGLASGVNNPIVRKGIQYGAKGLLGYAANAMQGYANGQDITDEQRNEQAQSQGLVGGVANAAIPMLADAAGGILKIPKAIGEKVGAMNQANAQAEADAATAAYNAKYPAKPPVEPGLKVRLDPKVGGAQAEQAAEKNLIDLGISQDPVKAYGELQPKMSELEQSVRALARGPEAPIQVDPMKSALEERLAKSMLPADRAKADSVVKGLLQEIGGGAPESPLILPDGVKMGSGATDETKLLNLKQKITGQLKTTDFSAPDRAPEKQALLAARDVIDEALSNSNPEIKKITTKQSQLFNATDSIEAQRTAAEKLAAKQPPIPPPPAQAAPVQPKFGKYVSFTQGPKDIVDAYSPEISKYGGGVFDGAAALGQGIQTGGKAVAPAISSNLGKMSADQVQPKAGLSLEQAAQMPMTQTQPQASPQAPTLDTVAQMPMKQAQGQGMTPERYNQAVQRDVQKYGGKHLAQLKQMFDASQAAQKALNPSAGVKMNSTQLKELTDIQDGYNGALDMAKEIETNKDLFGPVMGSVNKANPYNTRAQTLNQYLDYEKQIIGKALEGGVLRKEDEVKYDKILVRLNDTPEVAKNKLSQLTNLIKKRLDIKKGAYSGIQTMGLSLEDAAAL